MNEMYVYHVVTDRPMADGQRILFDNTHHSGVFQRVNAKLQDVKEIYAKPEHYKTQELEHMFESDRKYVRRRCQ